MKKPKKWSGSQTLIPIKYQKGLPTVAFNGYDLLPIGQQPVSVNMTFYPSFTATNVSLAGTDLSINDTSMQTIKLMSQTMASRSEDGADDFGNFLQGDGASFGGKAPNGLANTIDDGTTAATYGGLTRATYPGLKSYLTVATNNAISLLQLRTSWNNISDGGVRPDFIGTDYTSWAYVEQLMTPFQRNTSDFNRGPMTASASGYADLVWEGMVISRDKKFAAGNLYMMNLKFLEWQGLKWWKGEAIAPKGKDIEGNVYDEKRYQAAGVFTWTGMIEAINQGTINGFMIAGGQLICQAPFRQALISGIQSAA